VREAQRGQKRAYILDHQVASTKLWWWKLGSRSNMAGPGSDLTRNLEETDDETSHLLGKKLSYAGTRKHIRIVPDEGSPLRVGTPVKLPERGSLRPEPRSYWSYYFPAMAWISEYKLSYLIGDICAGLTIASFQIPISMSYATSLAYVPTVCGLYGLVVPPIVYALLGSVPQMVVGPEGAISLVVGQAITPYIHKTNQEQLSAAEVAGIISGASGAVLLSAGLLRFGFLDSVLSKALLRGFISAVGIVMVVDQLPSELGLADLMHKVSEVHPTTFGKLVFLINNWRKAHVLTAQVAATAFAVILTFRLVKRRYSSTYRFLHFVPEILLVVIASTMICDYFDLDYQGLEVVGKITPGNVTFEFPITPRKWHDFKANFSASFFAAVLGFFESTIAAKALGSIFDYNISSNRELVALGVCNLAGSLVCALPSFGGYGRSKVNALSGAKTQMAGLVLAGVTVLSIAFLMPFFFYLPKCVLSSVITAVGISLVEEAPADIKFYWKIGGYEDLFTLFLTLLFTVFWSVQTGIAVGVAFSLARVIHHATRPRIQILGRIPGTNIFRNADENPDALETVEGCLIVKIPEPLTFANTGDLGNRLRRLEFYGSLRVHPSHPRLLHKGTVQYIIIDLRGMTQCDSGAVHVLYGLIKGYVNRNITVIFTRVPTDKTIRKMFQQSGINDLVMKQSSGNAYFDTIDEALTYVDHVTSNST
jgi:high affinity sulfate transporter 1